MERTTTVSLVIPAHNAAKTIVATLQSVRGQSLRPQEVLLVDDGSTDDTAALIEDFLAKHGLSASWHLLRQSPCQGVSAARNLGIARATGDFLMFLDADDLLPADCLEHLTRMHLQTKADICVVNAQKVDDDGHTQSVYCNERCDLLSFSPADDIGPFVKYQTIFYPAWGKIFRRRLIMDHQLRFDRSLTYAEDTLFTCLAVIASKTIALDLQYCGYVYMLNAASATNTIDVPRRFQLYYEFLANLGAHCLGTRFEPILWHYVKENLKDLKKLSPPLRRRILKTQAPSTSALNSVMHPVVAKYGKTRHRLVFKAVQWGFYGAIRRW